MLYPKIPLAQSIIEIFRAKGIQNIVISPGSRNAPLTLGFTNNDNFNCYSIVDERCAAFFALGMAQQLQKPVAVVCTSGSALLNYYPAVAEAFYSQIPLIVVSADRPIDKIDIGDGQTIRQENVFENHSVFNANLTENANEENDALINKAINTAIKYKGPVHINAPFEEPLYQTINELTYFPKNIICTDIEDSFDENLSNYATIWNNSKKKLVLIGGLNPNEIENSFLEKLANDKSVVVLTETTSNIHNPKFINKIDVLITPFTEENFKDFQPDVLLTFGGMIVSKRIKTFLRKYKPQHHWHIDTLRAYDTYGCLSKHFKTSPNLFFESFFKQTINIESDYQLMFKNIIEYRNTKINSYIQNIPFSDLQAFEFLLKKITTNSQLQISNSSAIRYAQLFDIESNITVFCNRGTSGIDGSTSTAIGATVASKTPTVLITGDIGFFYDSNALWNNYIPKNFKIILLNNSGGGIFRILEGHQENTTFNTYFETHHQLTAQHLAKMYQLEYLSAKNIDDFNTALDKLFSTNDTPVLLEVFTPTFENDAVLKQFFEFIK
jgi:2-succinyl-5-enolpyruvyl-6-hydroxy-3-cyclohexene-1-carboxylate synthase